MNTKLNLYLVVGLIVLNACNQQAKKIDKGYVSINAKQNINFNGDTNTTGMVYIKGGEFMMGGDNSQADADEFPKHKVVVNDFWMDEHEITNAQFAAFVKATAYITTAEQKPDWEELKKQLAPNTLKPDESALEA